MLGNESAISHNDGTNLSRVGSNGDVQAKMSSRQASGSLANASRFGGSHPECAAKTPGGIVGLCAVMIDEDMGITAVAEQGSA